MERNLVSPRVVARILNHSPGIGVTGIYAKHDYDQEAREALALWARHIEALVDTSAVVPIAEVS